MCGKGYTLPEAIRFLIWICLLGEIDLQFSDSIKRCGDISAGLNDGFYWRKVMS
jgi:hypothetical protein